MDKAQQIEKIKGHEISSYMYLFFAIFAILISPMNFNPGIVVSGFFTGAFLGKYIQAYKGYKNLG